MTKTAKRRIEKRLEFARHVGWEILNIELLQGITPLYECDIKQINDLFEDAIDALSKIKEHTNTLLREDRGGDGE